MIARIARRMIGRPARSYLLNRNIAFAARPLRARGQNSVPGTAIRLHRNGSPGNERLLERYCIAFPGAFLTSQENDKPAIPPSVQALRRFESATRVVFPHVP